VHITNYVQEGDDIHALLRLMGRKVPRSVLFGIPLQQSWSYRISGRRAPSYYLDADSPLYYYSFTDAVTAMTFRSLAPADRARFDPMITGFNPADMYAADHIRRVLETFPGVFEGIGEFSVHKEFVSPKIAGETPSLNDPALDRILDFAGEVGLVVIIHNDMDAPFAGREGNRTTPAAYLDDMVALLRRHPKTTIIWAHVGVGRIVSPIQHHLAAVEKILDDPAMRNVYFDLSWAETAKYIVDSPEATRRTADEINRHPDRFLFGTDEVGPENEEEYFRVFDQYGPLWRALTPEASVAVRTGTYERLFDEARRRVRAWEKTHPRSESRP
jgi:hypothetical protein